MFNITKLSAENDSIIQHHINNKTKPLGALGLLETTAFQVVKVLGENTQKLKPQVIVFAAEHGIADFGVSIAPSVVTQQMVANFAVGGAGINVFCNQHNYPLQVVDCGLKAELNYVPNLGNPSLVNQRLGSGTNPFHQQAAMTSEQVKQGFLYAKTLVNACVDSGKNIFAFGEMGIGNTSSASALMSALLKLPAEKTVGLGTGIDNESLSDKVAYIDEALALHKAHLNDPISILVCLGGFEIVQLVGAILSAAEQKKLVVIDGFIVSVAALFAYHIAPESRDYMIFSHKSQEQAHEVLLNELSATPLLDIGLRLGEGTGAVLALPLIESALAFYHQMASFEEAKVDNVVE
ncbi:nicotinate-nucleotide--dimethylbenzimidazole phosphoribosyltransferase [Shewanella sp. 202IG2-18]|uniref:nicotinate-nucleotide--dimethylbenzimidazole phosphoribosyltransferase n=1 Tax=Parashewanella hymeniacidonis TaxID=2807618 RepID=UPI0019621344|nr:nicotinate-nucleotide--dimethylbenzimidazole phosphoribosyltransferase [Parashewanella hymeniacidonis]MBM7071790.1 nicotinate-nucleotide--dimethylbenzimidazole phosphoribosyltransferase [Parashewanella hymeniacidonis]